MNINKKIIGYCKNFYKIINFKPYEEDVISDRLIKIYQNYMLLSTSFLIFFLILLEKSILFADCFSNITPTFHKVNTFFNFFTKKVTYA